MQSILGVKSVRFLAIATALVLGPILCAQTESEWRAVSTIREARKAGDLPRALLYANKVIELAPKLAPAYDERAQIHHENGDKAAARRDIDRAIELQPEAKSYYGFRAKVRLEAFDYEGALADLARGNRHEETLNTQGEALIALKRYAEAAEIFKHLISGVYGPNTNRRFSYALCLLGLGRVEDAAGWFETDYNDGFRLDARRQLILSLCMLGKYDEAGKNLTDWFAYADKPAPEEDYDRWNWENLRENRDTAVYLSGMVRFAQEDFAGAAATLEKIKTDSAHADYARLLRQVALRRAKRPADALPPLGDLKDPWAQTLGRYLRGELKADELTRIARGHADLVERARQLCAANFYAAQLRLAVDDKEVAPVYLAAAVQTAAIDIAEYALAFNAAKKLEAAAKPAN